jgi:hypothetical protein
MENHIGAYQGQHPLTTDSGDLASFDIQADGAWTLRIDPIPYGGLPANEGKGDYVSAIFNPPGNGPWEIAHSGQRNFIV